MDGSQVPLPSEDSAPGRDDAQAPEASAPAGEESALWNEVLPWVDDVSGAEDAPSPAPDGPRNGQAPEPGKSGSARAGRLSRPARRTRQTDVERSRDRLRRRRGPMALGAGLVGTGTVAFAMIVATQHSGDGRPAAASVVRAETGEPASDSPGGHAPKASSSPGRSPSSAPDSPTPAGGGTSLSASPFPGATSAPATSVDDAHSSRPHTAPPAATPREPTTTPAPTRAPKVIRATAVLNPGQSVPWGKATLAMTPGGDLVVTDEHGVTRWASHTSGSDLQTVFQDDGCMAIYDPGGNVHWSSYTNGHPGAVLVITGNGNVEIKLGDSVLWQTGTGH